MSSSSPNVSGEAAGAERAAPRPRRKRRVFRWIVLLLLVLAFLWVAASSNPLAQGIRDFAGDKHDQTVIDNPFSVSPHSFRYYKFALPEGSTNVSLIGHFTALADSPTKNAPKSPPKEKAQAIDHDIELYVLSEPAFAIWQKGYSTGSVYASGRLAKAKVQTELPDGGGVYYVVFSNKFSATTAKKVDANLLLHYKSWIPEWLRREAKGVE